MIRLLRRAGLTGVCSALTGAWMGASACVFDGLVETDFDIPSLGAIQVVVSVRAAVEAHVLPAAALVSHPPGPAGFWRSNDAIGWMHDAMAGVTEYPRPPIFALLLVDSGLWTRFSSDGGRLGAERHAAGPRPGEPLVITHLSVLEDIRAGRLMTEAAMASGLVVIDGAGATRALHDFLLAGLGVRNVKVSGQQPRLRTPWATAR